MVLREHAGFGRPLPARATMPELMSAAGSPRSTRSNWPPRTSRRSLGLRSASPTLLAMTGVPRLFARVVARGKQHFDLATVVPSRGQTYRLVQLLACLRSRVLSFWLQRGAGPVFGIVVAEPSLVNRHGGEDRNERDRNQQCLSEKAKEVCTERQVNQRGRQHQQCPADD